MYSSIEEIVIFIENAIVMPERTHPYVNYIKCVWGISTHLHSPASPAATTGTIIVYAF